MMTDYYVTLKYRDKIKELSQEKSLQLKSDSILLHFCLANNIIGLKALNPLRYIPEVMKTGSANLNFLCNFSQLPSV